METDQAGLAVQAADPAGADLAGLTEADRLDLAGLLAVIAEDRCRRRDAEDV